MEEAEIKSEEFKLKDPGDKFVSMELDILEKVRKFFSADKKYIETMLEIIDGRSNISIRVLDWFVANYSKKNNTFYKIRINGKEEFFYVNNEYKNQLNGYSKNYFDPFCRKRKLRYSYKSNAGDKKVKFDTSIGQLNFFQWAIRNKVIRHVQLHIKEIDSDMKETTKRIKELKLQAMKMINEESDSESDDDRVDPVICSSDKINSVKISSGKKSAKKSDSSAKNKRQQLSRSVYEFGIKKSSIPIKLDFD
jgi:hypothetical protein